MIATIVDTHALAQVVWVSLVAGVGVSTAFSFVVLGAVRASESRRADRGGAAAAYTLMVVVGAALCLWAVYRGYLFIVDKS